MNDLIIYIIVFLLIISLLFSSYFIKKTKKLTKNKKSNYLNKIKEISQKEHSKQIIMFDSMLGHILFDLGYKGSIGEQLKNKPKELGKGINEIWELHKLRNKIAHELVEQDKILLEKSSKKYKNILENLLR